MTGLAAAVVVLLILLSAVITAGHAAAFQISASRLRTLDEEGFRGADALTAVRIRGSEVTPSARLVARTLNLFALGLGVASGAMTFGFADDTLNVIVGVVLIVVVADLVPHIIAARHPVRLGLAASPPLLTLARWTRFVSGPISRLEDALGGARDEDISSEARELREIQTLGQRAGIIEESENLLVERAFRLDELTAWDTMVPRVDIFAWSEDLTLDAIVDDLADVPYSRVPVYRESIDDVTGIVYVREAYERWARGERSVTLRELAREPFFVPGSVSLAHLLRDFQFRRIHMGIVADEFGGTDGLVTLEDVLEELVGDIHDETDREEQDIVRLSDFELEVDAGVDLRDISETLQVALPKVEQRSLNGFILEELGHVPVPGTSLESGGMRIDIVEATETQVVRARVTRLAPTRADSDH